MNETQRVPIRVDIRTTRTDNHVWIGDVDLRDVVTGVRIECRAGRRATVSLDLLPGAEVCVDGDLVELILPVLKRELDVLPDEEARRSGREWAELRDAASQPTVPVPSSTPTFPSGLTVEQADRLRADFERAQEDGHVRFLPQPFGRELTDRLAAAEHCVVAVAEALTGEKIDGVVDYDEARENLLSAIRKTNAKSVI